MIANHFNSKGGDEPLFGRFQPPVRSSEVAAPPAGDESCATSSARCCKRGLHARPWWCSGDFNDFEFSETLRILESGGRRRT